MASQSIVAVSPDGRYVAAQVHQYVQIVEQSTGAPVALPAPVFSLVADTADDAEADASAAADRGEEEEGAAEEQAADEAQTAADGADQQGASKKAKTGKDKTAGSKAGQTSEVKGGQRSHDGPKPIRVLAFHPNADAPFFMYNTDEKYIHLYHRHDSYESGFKHVLTVVVPRKVQTAVFHPLRWGVSTVHFEAGSSGSVEPRPLRLPQILVADKTGDIHTLSGTDLHIQTLEMGHLANITSLQFFESPLHGASTVSPANPPNAAAGTQQQSNRPRNYLLTSDSDGKIRISNSPNFFDIEAYCLGTQAFVSAFAVLPLSPPLVVSGGLGCEVALWSAETGTKLASFDLAAHRPKDEQDEAAASASTAPAAMEASTAEAAAQGCYVSSISLASTADGEFTLAVAVYPWPHIFMLTYAPSLAAHFSVAAVLPTPSTPMCVTLAGASAVPTDAGAASAAGTALQRFTPRLWFIDQQLQVHVLRRGTNCGQWKPAVSSGEASQQPAVKAALASLSDAFSAARAALGDTLITAANAGDFVGSGTPLPKKDAQSPAQEARAAAAAAAGNSGRYISPFSSTSHSSHLQRLGLLTAAGFAFRRFFDKCQREKFVSGKRAEAAQRREDNKKNRAANKAANQRQKKSDAAAAAAAENEQ